MSDYTFEAYRLSCATTARYPGSGEQTLEAVNYCVLGLAGEAGEIANKLKKVFRDSGGDLTPEMRAALLSELGDVMWYVDRLAVELGYSAADAAAGNVLKLADRKARGVLGGSGDNR